MRLLLLLAAAALGVYVLRNKPRLTPDERIEREVRACLPEEVRFTVVDGLVTLRGSLTAQERDDLLVAVLAVPGVVEVRNLLEIASRPGVEYAR